MTAKKMRVKKEIPTGETNAQRFVRVVTPRVSKALKAISVIGYCAKKPYFYTSEQADTITKALDKAVYELSEKFKATGDKGVEFNF